MRICHRLKVVPVLMGMAVALICFPLKTAASEVMEKEYTVTFRPGNIAEFSEEVMQEYVELYGADKVSVSQMTGSIAITVKAGSPYPEAPGPDDIVLDTEFKDKYYVTTSWRPSDEVVMEDQDYVVDFAALVNTVEYAVRYVDAQSGMDVAAPVISLGNIGDEVTFTAKYLTDYAYDTYAKQIVLEEGSENVITFYYTSTVAPKYETIELEGKTIHNTITITEDPVRIVQGETDDTQNNDVEAESGGTGTDAAGNQSETEDQEEKPQESDSINTEDEQSSNNPGQGYEQDEVIIEEEEIPLAAFLDENERMIGFIAAGLTGLAIVLIVIAYFIKKKERREE